jgi:hypothetical protein
MLAFEVGDLSVWVDNSLPAGVRYAYGHDDHGAAAGIWKSQMFPSLSAQSTRASTSVQSP